MPLKIFGIKRPRAEHDMQN